MEHLRFEIDSSLNAVDRIEAGVAFLDRSCFVNNLAARLRRKAAAGEVQLVDRALQHILTRQERRTKPYFAPRHSLWRLGIVQLDPPKPAKKAAAPRKTKEANQREVREPLGGIFWRGRRLNS